MESAYPVNPPQLKVLLGVNQRLDEIYITRMLNQAGHHVHVVATGQMAIGALRSKPFDLVLLDSRLDNFSAFGSTKIIRSLAGLSQVPIIGLLHENTPQMIASCLQAGMNSTLALPVTEEKWMVWLAPYIQEKLRKGARI